MIYSMASLPIGGIIYALQESNTAGKLIVIVLFVGSIIAWSVMLTKGSDLKQATRETRRFVTAYRATSNPVGVFLKRTRYEHSPTFVIYENACRALGAALEARGANPDDLFMGQIGTSTTCLNEIQASNVRSVAERVMAEQALLLENRMGFLATSATSAPFLGLLGTVWGVMESFGGMAATGSAQLSAVAPGISGALLTTVVGLLVALPSAIGYNVLSDRIRRMTVEMDNYVQELIADIEREYRQARQETHHAPPPGQDIAETDQ